VTPAPEAREGRAATRRVALLVEDDADFRESLAALIAREGFDTAEAASLAEARARLAEAAFDLVFVDLGLPDGNGLELLDPAASGGGTADVVVISGNATVESAVDALRQGALDFLVKPIDRNRLRAILANAERTRRLRSEVGELRGALRDLGRFGPMVGRSPVMQTLFDRIDKVAPTRATVMILGESGTGKELVAETIHRLSPRARGRFLAINCGAVAPNVIESELFGHEKGSFTGADKVRRGYFEEAHEGTLFLDEITEMSAELQVKLLRVLETGAVMRVGASESVPVDVRLIAATNRDPEKAIQDGKLRDDLYYRLHVFPIDVPPLRERPDDVELLAQHFLDLYNEREGVSKRWSPRALRQLRSHGWPGNVRELRNVVERAAIMAADVVEDTGLTAASERTTTQPAADGETLTVPIGESLAEVERKLIIATLAQTGGDKKETARRLGISLKTLYNRLNVYDAAGRLESQPADGAASRGRS
jgi:DNA-binding NtrC family response regulator